MNTVFDAFDLAGPLLWRAAWQAAVLTGIVLVTQFVLRERLSAGWRSGLWTIVLVRLLVPVLPPSPTSLFRLVPSTPVRVTATTTTERASAAGAAGTDVDETLGEFLPADEEQRVIPRPRESEIASRDEERSEAPLVPTTNDANETYGTNAIHLSHTTHESHSAPPPAATTRWTWRRIAVALWLTGVLVLGVRRAIAFFGLRRRMASWRDADSPALSSLFDECRRQMRVGRSVRLQVADEGVGPAVVGVLRPAVVLPASIVDSFSAAELEQIFLHELAHIRRHDVLLHRLWSLAGCLHWFNPFVRLAAAQMHAEREMACDAAVLSRIGGERRREYGDTLLKLADRLVEPRMYPGMVGVFGSQHRLQKRILMIARYREAPRRTVTGLALVALLIATGLTQAGAPQVVEESAQREPAVKTAQRAAAGGQQSAAEADASPEDAAAAARKREMASLAEKIRAEEKRYRNLELVINRQTRTVIPGNPNGGLPEYEETIHSVVQGDLAFCRKQKVQNRTTGEKSIIEFVSAFDGSDTRSVDSVGCANIHIGRNEMKEFVSQFDFRAALNARGIFSLSQWIDPERKAETTMPGGAFECSLDGEENIGELRCLKVKVISKGPLLGNSVEMLWLAPERNYHCVKSQFPAPAEGVASFYETHVDEFRQIAPGLWLPAKRRTIAVTNLMSDGQRTRGTIEETIILERAKADPGRPKSFFSEIHIPEGFQVYTLRDGARPEQAILEAVPPAGAAEKLASIVDQVRVGRVRTANLAVTLDHSRTQMLIRNNADFGGADTLPASRITELSVTHGGKSWFTASEMLESGDGELSRHVRAQAWDGEWTRSLQTSELVLRGSPAEFPRVRKGAPVPPRTTASFRKGIGTDAPLHEPHQLPLRGREGIGLGAAFNPPIPVADWLTTAPAAAEPQVTVEYLGEERRDGLLCAVVRRKAASREIFRSEAGLVLVWLAIERNHLPIRVERYQSEINPLVPTEVSLADDLREISAGVWYPFRIRQFHNSPWSLNWSSGLPPRRDLSDRRVTLIRSDEYQVRRAVLNPIVPAAQFSDLLVPAGTRVNVQDERGNTLGSYEHSAAGKLEAPDDKLREWEALALAAKEQKAALDALIGKPAPVLPETKEWLNSPPQQWSDLAGKTVLLVFWNELKAVPNQVRTDQTVPVRVSLRDLVNLQRQQLPAGEFATILITSAGSDPDVVAKQAADNQLNCPILIDVPVADDPKAPGELHRRFAVRHAPALVRVNGAGQIVSHGDSRDYIMRFGLESRRRPALIAP